jgi:hypothetical protein
MKNNIKLGLCSAAAALAIASTAHAFSNQDAIQYSYNGGAFVTAAIDADGAGLISTTINVGGFSLSVVSSHTYPFIGTQAFPSMDLAVQGKGTLIGTLLIQFSAIDYAPIPNGSYVTSLGVTDDAFIKASEVTTVGLGNTLYAPGVDGATIGGAALGSFTTSLAAPVAGQTAPYAITLGVTLNQTANNNPILNDGNISIDAHLRTVPDGGNTLMLLGSALSVLGLGVFRKSRKA